MRECIKENIVLICISFTFFLTEPAITKANVQDYNPVNFTKPLSLSRGKIIPTSRGGAYLPRNQSCRYIQEQWGWDSSSCESIENIIFQPRPGIDTLSIDKPNDDGFVSFDDWGDNAAETIDEIWDQYVEGSKAQSRKLGVSIVPQKWLVYPTLDKRKSYMYYAILVNWDGEPVVNADAALFDRYGYVNFTVIPENSNISEKTLQRLVESVLSSYTPKKKNAYFDFQDGDKVAAVGALGVLATLVGVKYGKGFFAATIGLVLALLKKFWVLIFLAPAALIKKLFGGSKDMD